MTQKSNVLEVGATRKGKTLAAARRVVESPDEAAVIFDPHKQSLAQAVLTHADGNVLYDRLSDLEHALSYEMLAPSTHPNPLQRQLENQMKAEAFVAILLRRRDAEGMASTPLMEEWVMAVLMLFLNQADEK